VDGGIAHPFDTPPAPGEAQEVAPGILWIRLPLPMALNHVNVYALADDDGWTLALAPTPPARCGRAFWPDRWQGARWREYLSPITTPTMWASPAGSRRRVQTC
jgi:hypothetical protein